MTEQSPSPLLVGTAEIWNTSDRTMADIAQEFDLTVQAIQRRLYRAAEAGLLTRQLPGKEYHTNRSKFNRMNRSRANPIKVSKVALQALDDRSRIILTERRLKEFPTTLRELADRFSLSRERVRQIEVEAIKTVQGKKEQENG